MNKEIVVGFLIEHGKECCNDSISRHIREKRKCTFCLDINRDTSLLITHMGEARKTIDVGLALSSKSKLAHYLPYQTAGFKLFFQHGESESEHILHVLKEVFSQGYERAVVLSHSVPNLPVDYIERAVEYLRKGSDLVMGPLENGMFYLVGLARDMFERLLRLDVFRTFGFVDGTASEETLRVLKDHALKPRFLPKWYVVKSLEDLRKLCEDTSLGRGRKTRWIGSTIEDLSDIIR
jgi:glycosyltransferase A (GT-A) superfamily protein (DUF2064 family)